MIYLNTGIDIDIYISVMVLNDIYFYSSKLSGILG